MSDAKGSEYSPMTVEERYDLLDAPRSRDPLSACLEHGEPDAFSTLTLMYDVPLPLDAKANCLDIVRFLFTDAHPVDTVPDPETASMARKALDGIGKETNRVRERYGLAQD